MYKIFVKTSQEYQQKISVNFDTICQVILPLTQVNPKLGQEDTFANRLDTDVVSSFASLLF